MVARLAGRVELDGVYIRYAREDVAGHQAAEVVILVVQRGQQFVGRDLRAQHLVRLLDPLAVDLPALIHIRIHLGEETLCLLEEGLGHVQFDQLVVDHHLQYHLVLPRSRCTGCIV